MTTRRALLRTGAAGVLALTAGTATTTPAAATTRSKIPDPYALQAVLDELTATAASAALAEVHHAGQTWRGVSGVTELGTTRPVHPDGRFRIGSLTKSFVATVVLQLVGERRLSLDDTLERRLPGAVPAGARITLRHLMQHTSGLVNYTNLPGFRALYGSAEAVDRLRHRTWAPAEILALIDGQPLLFEPGTSWAYANTNYILLALIVERVTGRGYGTEVEGRILRPLGLRDTSVPGTRATIAGPHAHGYLPLERAGGVEPLDVTEFNPSVAWSSGEMISSTADLDRFYRALMTGRLLRPAQLAEMRTARVTGRKADYGLGLQTRLLPGGVRVWGHGGDIFGYEAASWSTADGRRRLTVSFNPWGAGDTTPVIEKLLATAFAPA
ncbi:serine hydrolase domain-containing protein [Micromonosporaceae bacterium Da 78-11]